MQRRSALRALIATAALVAAALTASSSAQAGTMTYMSCSDARGVTSSQGWSVKTSGGGQAGTSEGSAQIRCGLGGIIVTLGTDRPTNLGVYGETTFAAPADTSIINSHLNLYYYVTWPVPAGAGSQNPYAVRVWHDSWSPANMLVVSDIGIGQRFERPWYVHSNTGVEWKAITAQLSCANANNGAMCNHGGGELWIGNAQLDLRDDHAPSVANVEGTLATRATATGTTAVRFNASDRGVGVYRTTLHVDGTLVADKIADDNGGRCVPRSSRYTFGWATPCKLATSDEIEWDSATVLDGTHTITVRVEDAAGNRSIVLDRTITTDNKPANTAPPTLTPNGALKVGTPLTLNVGTWERSPTAFDTTWERCPADRPDACVMIPEANGQLTYSLSEADAYHAIRARVHARNASGAAAAITTTATATIADADGLTDPRPRLTRAPSWADAAAAAAPRVGTRLAVDPGTWSGPRLHLRVTFYRCAGDSCVTLSDGAPSHTVGPADVGATVHAVVSAANFAGSAAAATPRSAAVIAPDDHHGRDGNDDDARRPNDDRPRTPPTQPDYGIDGLTNPMWGQGHVSNGAGASDNARLTVGFDIRARGRRVRRTTVRSKRSQRQVIRGQLLNDRARPISGAKLVTTWQHPGGRWIAKTGVTTLADGRFAYILPMGASRKIRFVYFPFGDSTRFTTSNTISQHVEAPVTLRATPSRARNGRTVRFAGTVGRDGVPARGVLVTLEARFPGSKWKQFRVVRATRSGRFSARYRFTATSIRTRYAFRARVAKQGQYPFETGLSAAVKVEVLP